MKRFVDNLRPSRSTRHAMLIGAVLGIVFAVTEASAPVIYGGILLVGVAFFLIEDHLNDSGLPHRDFWRRR